MAESSLQKGRKHCGKRKNCSLRTISPLSTVFSEDLCGRQGKSGLVWKGLMTLMKSRPLKTL